MRSDAGPSARRSESWDWNLLELFPVSAALRTLLGKLAFDAVTANSTGPVERYSVLFLVAFFLGLVVWLVAHNQFLLIGECDSSFTF